MRNLKFICLTILMLLLCSCHDRGTSDLTMAAIQTVGRAVQIQYELPAEVTDRSSWVPEADIQKIASFEENISLFGIYENGKTSVLIQWEGSNAIFDWSYLTPLGFSLTPYCFDLDQDGSMDLIVDIVVGTGTGIAVSELHVVQNDPENGTLTDYALPEALYPEVNELLSMSYSQDSITLSAADQQLVVPYDNTAEIQELCPLGSSVGYDISGDSVTISFGVGVTCDQNLVKYVAMLNAEVKFSDGVYALGNFTLVSW